MALIYRILFFLFASGFCALVYQMAWLRLLRLVFGSSTAASAAVLAIFMGGLGLGSLILGKRAEKSRNPLRFYALLEIGIALAAGVSPWSIGVVRWLYELTGGSTTLGGTGATVLRLLLSLLVLGVPTFLMGGTLPAAVRAATRSVDEGRRALGKVYAVNTLGAVVGAIATTFLLLEELGVQRTIWIAALLNLLVAITARSTSRRQGSVEPIEVEPEEMPLAQGAGEERAPVRLLMLAAGGVGFAFFLMELVWYRMLAPILGGSTYTFGLILITALAGIGLGGWLYGSGEKRRRPTLMMFATTCAVEAMAMAVPFALGDRLAYFAHVLRDLQTLGFLGLTLGWALITCIVVLPAAIVAGYQFPLLVGVLGSSRRGVARQVGLTYAWNTGGAILGSLAGGFGLLPLLSAPGAWRLAVGILVLLAAVAALRARAQGATNQMLALPALALAISVVMISGHGPGAFWRHGGVGAGRGPTDWKSPNDMTEGLHSQERSVVWEVDGRESSVALKGAHGYSFSINGKTDGHCRADAPTQVMSTVLGAVLHPDPRTGMVIGLGTGSSAGWLGAIESLEHLDVVELEPAILGIAEACTSVNHQVLQNPRVEIELADAREVLLTSDRKYDVIFSEPSNPYRAGIASLFSQEFYEAILTRLNDHGIFVQWLQAYEVDAEVVRGVYSTLGTVFSEIETWEVHDGDLMLLATREPIAHDVPTIRARLQIEPYRSALEKTWGVRGAEGLYAGFVASGGFAQQFADGSRAFINTDDRPRIEFGFARGLGRLGLFATHDLRQLAETAGFDRPREMIGELDWELVREQRRARGMVFGSGSDDLPPPPDEASGWRQKAREAWSRGELERAASEWLRQDQEPRNPLDLVMVAEGLAAAADERVLDLLEVLRVDQRVESDAIEARWLARGGDPDAALAKMADSLTRYRVDPWPEPNFMYRALDFGVQLALSNPERAAHLLEILSEPFALHLHDEVRQVARLRLAKAAGFERFCAQVLEPFEPYPIWIEGYLRNRVACYEASGHPLLSRARRDLYTFEDRLPPSTTKTLGSVPEASGD